MIELQALASLLNLVLLEGHEILILTAQIGELRRLDVLAVLVGRVADRVLGEGRARGLLLQAGHRAGTRRRLLQLRGQRARLGLRGARGSGMRRLYAGRVEGKNISERGHAGGSRTACLWPRRPLAQSMGCFILALIIILAIAGLGVLVGLGMLMGALLQHRAEQQFWDHDED